MQPRLWGYTVSLPKNILTGLWLMADVKTHLRELSVATTVGLLSSGVVFQPYALYNSKIFLACAKKGYKLGKAIFENKHFAFEKPVLITWQGNDTQPEIQLLRPELS